jgi:hypothetical protein
MNSSSCAWSISSCNSSTRATTCNVERRVPVALPAGATFRASRKAYRRQSARWRSLGGEPAKRRRAASSSSVRTRRARYIERKVRSHISVNRWGPAFDWLRRNAGLTDPEIARAFDCSPNSVAQARSRHKRRRPPVAKSPQRRGTPPNRTEVGPGEDARLASLDHLYDEIEDAYRDGLASGDFISASRHLRGLLPRIGNPSSTELIAARARIHQHRAWLSVHLGFCAHALAEATKARERFEVVIRETGDVVSCRRWWESGLVCSLALLNNGNPNAANRYLKDATSACARVQRYVGSEHFRQEASVLVQVGNEEDALTRLRYTSRAAVDVDRLPSEGVQALLLPGVRQALFLERDWEKSRAALDAAALCHGASSAAFASHLTWTIATALCSDSEGADTIAMELISRQWEGLQQWRHQSAVFYLLSVTPKLRLTAAVLPHWLRWIMHANPYASVNPDRSV